MVAEAVETALETLFFGSTWYFGILIFIVLSLAIMKINKYSAALIIPMVVALEVEYYNRLDVYGNFVWAMLSLLMLVIFIIIYIFTAKQKD